jgi:7-cyano-7-deazaguanine reductase
MMPTDAQTTHLTELGDPGAKPDSRIDAFPIDDPSQVITLDCGEFTCRCRITGQPDWATISIEYRPSKLAVETKSYRAAGRALA